MSNIHDSEIISYEVDLKNQKIIISTIQYPDSSITELVFSDVLAHLFETHLEGSIILDVDKYELSQFINDNRELLEKQKNSCWPIDYYNIEELTEKLRREQYVYFVVSSSYGLNGWILAKKYEVLKNV
ncbi:hypothetical protein ACFQ5D_02490 [Paenibacillus farraposensis]|uniref:Uncharacterized protein n=1 Tax=Paenibacillus farraposensis TaxID=2807095 RepID=A0ABW4DB27_9BACL|nr:hypothetical protein [Paenibacillus farraposensis]MCC3381767.1 hypothetical protein [Paenibacillus farraposensis]